MERIFLENLQGFLLVIGRLIVNDLIYSLVEKPIFVFNFGHLGAQIFHGCLGLAQIMARLQHLPIEFSVFLVSQIDRIYVFFVLQTQLVQSSPQSFNVSIRVLGRSLQIVSQSLIFTFSCAPSARFFFK